MTFPITTTIHAELNGDGRVLIDIQTSNGDFVAHKLHRMSGWEAGVLRDELNEVLRVMNRVG